MTNGCPMAWTGAGSTDGSRPPRPLIDLAEQLALAAAADFTRRLADLVVLEDGPSSSGSIPAAAGATSAGDKSRTTGAITPDGELDRAEAEELDLLRSRLHSLATLFADKFTTCVDEQVTTLWKQQLQHDDERPEGSDATPSGTVPMKTVIIFFKYFFG